MRSAAVCAALRQSREAGLWRGEGDPSFEAWARRTLGLGRGAVTKMLAIAAGPVGGPGRRPGRKPAAPLTGEEVRR